MQQLYLEIKLSEFSKLEIFVRFMGQNKDPKNKIIKIFSKVKIYLFLKFILFIISSILMRKLI